MSVSLFGAETKESRMTNAEHACGLPDSLAESVHSGFATVLKNPT